MKNSRYVGERPHRYHRWHTGVFVGASPVCIPGTPCCKFWKTTQKSRSQKDQITYGQTKQWKQTSSGRSFTSIQMFHTHKRKSSYLSKATERSQWASHDVSHCDFCTCESWDGEGPCTFPTAASQFDPRISPMAQEAVEHKQQGSEKRLWATLGRSTCHCSNSSASHLDVSYCTSMVSMWICMWCGP